MAQRRPPSKVRIEQPTPNKVITLVIGGTASFMILVLVSSIDARGFQIGLLVFLLLVLVYCYRSINIAAVADRDRIEVTNLLRRHVVAWRAIDRLEVAPVRGGGTGIEIVLVAGDPIPIEASWGPWFQGRHSSATTRRCEAAIAEIDAMRTHVPVEIVEEIEVDPVVVRPTSLEDVEAVAAAIDRARRETYAEVLPGQVFQDDDRDAEALRLLIEAGPPAGSLLVEHDGAVVGASVFGPAAGDGLEGFTEVYMIYVRSAHLGTTASRRLALATCRAIRASGSNGIVGHVYVNHRTFRSRIEALGISKVGEPTEQLWYGLPVRVVEYRQPFDVPA